MRDSDLPTGERLEALQHAMAVSRDIAEKRLVLGALGTVPSPEALQLAIEQLGEEELVVEAASAVLQIARLLGAPQHRAAVQAALNEIIATCQDEAILKQARQQLRKR